jgi:hypothetical protein
MFKPYNIDALIEALKDAKEKHGNCLVELSTDSEGNEFNPIGNYETVNAGKKEIMLPFGFEDGKLIIYPCEE